MDEYRILSNTIDEKKREQTFPSGNEIMIRKVFGKKRLMDTLLKLVYG